MENTPLKKPLTKGQMISAVTISAILLVIIIGTMSPETKTPNTPKNEEMKLEIRRSVTEKDFSGQVLIVKNMNSIEWEDCVATINDDYSKNISGIFLPSKLVSPEDSRDYMIFPVGGFTKSDGTYFDAKQQVILKALITCKKPYISAYSGSFSQ